MGIPSAATGDSVAPFLVGIPQAVQKQRELSFADMHHSVDIQTIQANRIAASATGIHAIEELMDWNGMGMSEQWSPARLGCDLEELLGCRKRRLAKRAISNEEVRGQPGPSLPVEDCFQRGWYSSSDAFYKLEWQQH